MITDTRHRVLDKVAAVPHDPGIYKFLDSQGEIIYVGKAKDLKIRVSSYFRHDSGHTEKTKAMVLEIADLSYVVVLSEFEALLLEIKLINKLKPPYNILAKDDKSFLYIKIDKRAQVPIVEAVRKQMPHRGVFLIGPFPSGRTVRSVLRNIRHAFPYCTHRRPQKSCLYAHLGLCPDPWHSSESLADYRKTIDKIVLLLSGKSSVLSRSLSKEMEEASKREDYEQASVLKKQIEDIAYITQSFHQPEDYLAQPGLVEEKTREQLKELKDILGLRDIPIRIECYDISNFQGREATGSMVVFTGGAPDKSQYRRFKIKRSTKSGGPDDFAMMREVIGRRLHNDWPRPDLMIIDGGKGQLSSAMSVVLEIDPTLVVVSLAKRIEEIFVPGHSQSIVLPMNSPALTLVRALRDEAHRFAITYHRKLRSKKLIESLI